MYNVCIFFFIVGGFWHCKTRIPHLNCSRLISIIAYGPLFIMANKVGRGNSRLDVSQLNITARKWFKEVPP